MKAPITLRRSVTATAAMLALALTLSACGATPTPTPAPIIPIPTATAPAATATKPAATATVQPTALPAQPLSESVLKNAAYSLPDVGQFQLKDGSYEKKYGEGATRVNKVNFTRFALGDLNGDGVKDAAVILALNTGGTGTFIHMAAVLDQKGVPLQAAVASLGDRTVINSLAIENGGIMLDMLTHSSSDPLCCPSQKTTRTYRLEGATLKMVAESMSSGPTPAVVAAVPALPAALTSTIYRPQTYSCDNLPARTMTDKIWQGSAPRIISTQTAPGTDVEIGLRNKFGETKEQYKFTAYVIAPDRSITNAPGTVSAAEWGMLLYPKNFSGAKATVNGIYTVVYAINGGVVYCDGFVIGPFTP